MTGLRYLILKEWLRFFFGSVFVLFLILTIANLISGFLRGNVTATEVLINYLIEVPSSFNKIFPISCLIASIFSVNKLKNRNELVAIFASGFSTRDFLEIIASASLGVAIIQFIMAGYIDPFARKYRGVLLSEGAEKFKNLSSKGLKAATIGSGKIWFKSDNYFFSFNAFDKANNSLKNVDLYLFDNDHKIIEKIKARELAYEEGGQWVLKDGFFINKLEGTGFPELVPFSSRTFTLSESPDDFRQIESDITTLGVGSLWNYVKRIGRAGLSTSEYMVMLLDKFSSALICLVFGLMAAIGIFNPNRRQNTLGKNLGFIFVFTLLYWLIYTYLIELGSTAKINPWLACFLVPAVFGVFITIVFVQNRRLS